MNIPDLPLEFEKMQPRVYIHEKCGTATRITDDHFFSLCDSFDRKIAGTRCVKCGYCTLGSVAWQDTGEKISDYRARIRRVFTEKVGQSPLILGGIFFMSSCIIVGPLCLFSYYQDAGREPLLHLLFFLLAVLFFSIVGFCCEYGIRSKRTFELCKKHRVRVQDIK